MPLQGLIETLGALMAKASREELRGILLALATLQVQAAAFLCRMPLPETQKDRLLTAKETAVIANISPRWLYDNAAFLPFSRRIGRSVRFSESGLREWLSSRRA